MAFNKVAMALVISNLLCWSIESNEQFTSAFPEEKKPSHAIQTAPPCLKTIKRGAINGEMKQAIEIATGAARYVVDDRLALQALLQSKLKQNNDPDVRYAWVIAILLHASTWGDRSHLEKNQGIQDEYVQLYEFIRWLCKKYRFPIHDVAAIQEIMLEKAGIFPKSTPIRRIFDIVLGNWGHSKLRWNLFVRSDALDPALFNLRLETIRITEYFESSEEAQLALLSFLNVKDLSAEQFLDLCISIMDHLVRHWTNKHASVQKHAYQVLLSMQQRSRRYYLEQTRLDRLKHRIVTFARGYFTTVESRGDEEITKIDYLRKAHQLVNDSRWGR